MAEGLRSVPQLLATDGNLLAKHTKMVAERHDTFKESDGLVEIGFRLVVD